MTETGPNPPPAPEAPAADTPDPEVPWVPDESRPTVWFASEGDDVADLQGLLQGFGHYDPKLAGDEPGVFGRSTDAAVRAFQSSHGLAEDGMVGPTTWWHLTTTDS